MRLGKVVLDIGYLVDLDNDQMVKEAMASVYEDICSAIKYNELASYIKVRPDNSLLEEDIPEFLKLEEEI
uniref:Uncharacterized protein n=1 Tax=viral metagenome TaxID=1070528 RepID=A0A6H1ZAB0_9ZZZZ